MAGLGRSNGGKNEAFLLRRTEGSYRISFAFICLALFIIACAGSPLREDPVHSGLDVLTFGAWRRMVGPSKQEAGEVLKKPLAEIRAEEEFWTPDPLRRYKEAQELQQFMLADPARP